MKKNHVLFCLTITLFACLIGCTQPITPTTDSASDDEGQIDVNVSIGYNAPSIQTLELTEESITTQNQITKGSITISNDNTAYTFALTVSRGLVHNKIVNLPQGTWDLDVRLQNEASDTLYRGTSNATIVIGQTTIADITVYPVTGEIEISFSLPAVKVDATQRTLYILLADGTLIGSGENSYGMFGLGEDYLYQEEDSYYYREFPYWATLLTDVKDFDINDAQALAIKINGDVYFAGSNNSLNIIGETYGSFPEWTSTQLVRIEKVSVAFSHSLSLGEDGTFRGSGDRYYGQLGIDGDDDSWANLHIDQVEDFVAGEQFSMFITEAGNLYVSGGNSSGCIGQGNEDSVSTWTFVTSNVKEIATGDRVFGSMFLKEDGTLYAAGYNSIGILGFEDSSTRKTYTLIDTDVDHIFHSSSWYGGYRKENGTVMAMGANSDGLLDPVGESRIYTPTEFEVPDNTTEVIFEAGPIYALTADGHVWAKGYNSYGRFVGYEDGAFYQDWILIY